MDVVSIPFLFSIFLSLPRSLEVILSSTQYGSQIRFALNPEVLSSSQLQFSSLPLMFNPQPSFLHSTLISFFSCQSSIFNLPQNLKPSNRETLKSPPAAVFRSIPLYPLIPFLRFYLSLSLSLVYPSIHSSILSH